MPFAYEILGGKWRWLMARGNVPDCADSMGWDFSGILQAK